MDNDNLMDQQWGNYPAPPVQANIPPVYMPGQAQPGPMPPYQGYAPYPGAIPERPLQSSAKAALKWGSIFGAILVVFVLIQYFAIPPLLFQLMHQFYIPYSRINLFSSVIHYLIFSVVYFCLGIVASRQSGKVATGTLASLWANLWAYVAVLLLDGFTYVSLSSQLSSRDSLNLGTLLSSLITSYVIGLLIALALGAGLGALGGLLGKALAGNRPQAPRPL